MAASKKSKGPRAEDVNQVVQKAVLESFAKGVAAFADVREAKLTLTYDDSVVTIHVDRRR